MPNYDSAYTGTQLDQAIAWAHAFGAGVASDEITYPNTYYKDHIISLAGINPVGPATSPTMDPDGEGWLFASGAENVGVLSTQINHDCVQGENVIIIPHVHVRKTTDAAGGMAWKLEYKSAAVGGDFGEYVEVATATAPIAATTDNNTAARHLIYTFGNLALTVGLSTIVVFKMTRVVGNAADTYGGNALAMSFDFHYPVNSPGSKTEYSK